MYNEVAFGVDSFGKPKVLSTKDSIAQLIKNILMLSPGQIPSMPHIGINIRQYLYSYVEDTDLSNLKDQIAYQCGDLIPYIDLSGITVAPVEYQGRSTIFIVIPINIEGSDEDLVMGVTKSADGRVAFRYKFDDALQ